MGRQPPATESNPKKPRVKEKPFMFKPIVRSRKLGEPLENK
jgi:hypothetical protein